MNTCEALLDLMPMVAAGRVAWPDGAEAHLGACAECQAAWRIIQAGTRLGRNAGPPIDAVATATRLSRADRRRRGIGVVGALAAAAAIALVVWSGHPGAVGSGSTPGTLTVEAREFVIPVPGLDDLDAGQLQAVYQGLDAPLGAGGSASAPSLEELSPEEMSQVLSTFQG